VAAVDRLVHLEDLVAVVVVDQDADDLVILINNQIIIFIIIIIMNSIVIMIIILFLLFLLLKSSTSESFESLYSPIKRNQEKPVVIYSQDKYQPSPQYAYDGDRMRYSIKLLDAGKLNEQPFLGSVLHTDMYWENPFYKSE
jgi:hypothetical protein